MTRIHPLLLAGLLVVGACEKKPEETTPPDPTSGTTDEPVAIDTSVPQEPDPPELAQGAQQYLLGQYAEVVTLLTPIYADLKERQQYRASAIAGAWLALAHAKQVYENAKEPAEYALSMAQSTEDPEVDAAAGLAMAAYQIGHEEFDPAAASLRPALAAKDGVSATLAHVLHAEALIGAAFGGGDSESVQNPAKFDEAKTAYDAAAAKAKGTASSSVASRRATPRSPTTRTTRAARVRMPSRRWPRSSGRARVGCSKAPPASRARTSARCRRSSPRPRSSDARSPRVRGHRARRGVWRRGRRCRRHLDEQHRHVDDVTEHDRSDDDDGEHDVVDHDRGRHEQWHDRHAGDVRRWHGRRHRAVRRRQRHTRRRLRAGLPLAVGRRDLEHRDRQR
jgi:hypothetical protein